MSKNAELEDLNSPARLHDGWAYSVDLYNGRSLRLHDSRRLDAVVSSWMDASLAISAGRVRDGTVSFSGARENPLEDCEECDGEGVMGENQPCLVCRGKKEVESRITGKGNVLSGQIVSIRYWDKTVDAIQDLAIDSARALFELQREATLAQLEETVRKSPGAAGPTDGGLDDDEEDAERLEVDSGGEPKTPSPSFLK